MRAPDRFRQAFGRDRVLKMLCMIGISGGLPRDAGEVYDEASLGRECVDREKM